MSDDKDNRMPETDQGAEVIPLQTGTEIKAQVEQRVANEDQQENTGGGGGDEVDGDFIRECLNANQLGDGELFKRVLTDRLVFNKAMDCWMVWDGHHWKIDELDQAYAMVEEVVAVYQAEAEIMAKKAQDAKDPDLVRYFEKQRERLDKRAFQLRGDQRRNQCVKMAHTTTNPMAITGHEIDCQPWLLACANGVVDLKTGELRAGSPRDYLLRAAPTDYLGIDAPREAWAKALVEIFNGDHLLVGFQQRLFGYALVGAVLESIFPVLMGPGGRNGKTTIMEAINNVLGPLSGPIPSDMLLSSYKVTNSSGPSPDIMELRGLRVAWASETNDGAKVSVAKCKWLTGKDTLTGRYPHDKRQTTFKPTHTLFLMSNFRPHADAGDKAFWERLIELPFTMRFLRNRKPVADNERVADIELDAKLAAEASGILGWMVEGCLRWQQEGLNPPPAVVAATEEYFKDEDFISSFIDYCCNTGPEDNPLFQVGATELYNAFEAWFKKFVHNFPPKQRKFGKQMRERFKYDKVGGLYRYFGINLNREVMEEIRPSTF